LCFLPSLKEGRKYNPPPAEAHFIYPLCYSEALPQIPPWRDFTMLVEDPFFSGDKKRKPPFSFQYPEASIPAEAGFYEWAYLKT